MNELMLPERQQRIRDRLSVDGRVIAASLAAEFGVSEDTIRRDLRDMAAAGLCERVYGGALPVANCLTSLAQRSAQDKPRKQRLARTLLSSMQARSVVFLDAGSTNLALAELIPDAFELTIITNAAAIALALAEKPSVETILIGGKFDRMVGGAVGAEAVEQLRHFTPDLCVIGTCGFSRSGILSVYGHEDAAFKRAAVSQAKETAVAVTTEKIGVSAPFQIAEPGQYHRLIVEEGLDADSLFAARQHGCQIQFART